MANVVLATQGPVFSPQQHALSGYEEHNVIFGMWILAGGAGHRAGAATAGEQRHVAKIRRVIESIAVVESLEPAPAAPIQRLTRRGGWDGDDILTASVSERLLAGRVWACRVDAERAKDCYR